MTHVNWVAVAVGVVLAQIYLTVWFAVVFKRPWAEAYGVSDPTEHTRAIPGYTYAIGGACALLLNLGLSMLCSRLGVTSAGEALALGLLVAVCFVAATALPGYAFLQRWRAGVLAIGSQVSLVVGLSLLHALL